MKPFKTAKELGLKADEYEALLWVRRSLADGTIPKALFNMSEACARYDECGSVCCIGGWMYMHMSRSKSPHARRLEHHVRNAPGLSMTEEAVIDAAASQYVCYHYHLQELFYPRAVGIYLYYDKITPAQAVRAIDNLLLTGDPDWGAAVATP